MPEKNTFNSFHGFIFPFEWKNKNSLTGILEPGEALNLIDDAFLDSSWKRYILSDPLESLTQYNEVNYFYDFVRPALYDTDQKTSIVRSFIYQLPKDAKFLIKKGDFSAELRLESIELRLYAIGVGVLSFQCINDDSEQADTDTILKINQYGRRLFPPFYKVQEESAYVSAYYTEAQWESGLEAHPELPDSIQLILGHKNFIEKYETYKNAPRLNTPPGLLKFLLPESISLSCNIQPILDDRMFVVSYMANDEIPAQLKNDFWKNDLWYRYVFVDVDRTVQNTEMMNRLLEQHSYLRWSDWGSYYGLTRYAFVGLASKQAPAFLLAHMRTIYMRMAELALLQRACVLRLSEEVTVISTLEPNDRKLPVRMEKLFRQHLRFVNKLYFREVTAQEQGIELYDMLRASMRLEEQVGGLDKEMAELQRYSASIAEDARNEKLDMLTYIGAFLAVPGFVVSYYSSIEFKLNDGNHWIATLGMFLVYALLVILIMRSKGLVQLILGLLLYGIVLFSLFGLPTYYK